MDRRERLEALRLEYAGASTEEERAAIELRAWNEHGMDAKRDKIQAHTFLAQDGVLGDLGCTAYDSAQRLRLYGYGDTATPLWQRVEGDMSVRTAVELAYKARTTKLSSENIYHAMARVLATYDALPMVCRAPNGKVVRKPAKNRLRSEAAVATSPPPAPRRAHAPTGTLPPGRHPTGDPLGTNDRSFWSDLRSLIGPYMYRRLHGQSELVIENEIRHLETDLKVVFDQSSQRVYDVTRATPMSTAVLRRRLLEACRALRIDPPKPDEVPSPAFFNKARRQFKEMARVYHPDTNGTDATRPQFEAVMEAWSTVQAYQQTLR